jgi:methylthioribose-1-phosphate isomerase
MEVRMNVQGQARTTVWVEIEPGEPVRSGRAFDVRMIEQRLLPHEFKIVVSLADHRETARAIREMMVRGAPAIGASAAYGLAQVYAEAPSGAGREGFIAEGLELLRSSRPTAQDLFAALAEVSAAVKRAAPEDQAAEALRRPSGWPRKRGAVPADRAERGAAGGEGRGC